MTTTHLKEIDVASVQRAASAEHYIATASKGTHEAMLPTTIAPLLTNPMTRLHELHKLSDSAEYFAANGIVGSLGYSVVTNLLWDYRKRNMPEAAPAPSIDIFGGEFQELYAAQAKDVAMVDNGYAKLPDFVITKTLQGVYMNLLYAQRGNPSPTALKYPVTMPNQVLHEMQTRDRTAELNAAIQVQEDAELAASPARHALAAATSGTKKAFDEHQVRMHKLEQESVLKALRDTLPEPLSNAAWESIPLYVQYKWTMSVYNQAVKAFAYERALPKRDSDKISRLLDMISEMHLELEAANRTAEVRLAFDLGRLTERHGLITEAATAKAQSTRVIAAAKFVEGNQTKAATTDAVDEAIAKFEAKRDKPKRSSAAKK